jgi:hypothetical protein
VLDQQQIMPWANEVKNHLGDVIEEEAMKEQARKR